MLTQTKFKERMDYQKAVTRVADTHVPDSVYEQARQQFDEAELVNLTFVISTINVWNRILTSIRREPGSYQPVPHVSRLSSGR